MGKCPDCGTWDALQEYKEATPDARRDSIARSSRNATADVTRGADPLTLEQIDESDTPRTPTGIGEFDRILGGGIVAGSAVLVGGEPGIGKSTLLLRSGGSGRAKWLLAARAVCHQRRVGAADEAARFTTWRQRIAPARTR